MAEIQHNTTPPIFRWRWAGVLLQVVGWVLYSLRFFRHAPFAPVHKLSPLGISEAVGLALALVGSTLLILLQRSERRKRTSS